MNTEIITETEIASRAISNMPTRPTAPLAFGGSGYTAKEMKSAFDALPRLIAERVNSLILDIKEGRVLDGIPTQNESLKTLGEIVRGIEDGGLAACVKIFDTTLALFLAKLRSDVDTLLSREGYDE